MKFHFKSDQGIKCLTSEEAAKIAGEDPDYAGRDLFEAIERKEFPRWNLKIQVMPEREAETYTLNPFDLTKIWSHKDYPLVDVAVLELDRNPENYFAEVEQAAFSPSNLPPGIGVSPDKMLQARLFAYPDAQRYRIGANYQSLPVNRPKNAANNYQRDGTLRFDGNSGNWDNFEPNDFGGPVQDTSVKEPPLKISGDLDRYNAHKGNDDYSQAGALYNIMSEDQKDCLTTTIAGTMQNIPKELALKNIEHFKRCDKDYGKRIEKNLS